MPNIGPFEKHSEQYEDWFDRNSFVYESEIEAIRELMPDFNKGIEIGIGSGRFAVPLGIKFGLEPSSKMSEIAKKRKIKVVDGVGERMPFSDASFDLVLMVTTLCFLDDAKKTFDEAYRILEKGGVFINGFVDKDSPVGKIYQKNKEKSMFYKTATFYSVDEVKRLLAEAGFKDLEYRQTVFKPLNEIKGREEIKKGFGEGSFVAISAKKH